MPYNRSAFVTNTPQQDVCFDFMTEQTDYVADSIFTPKPVSKTDTKVYQADTSKLRLVDSRSKTNSQAKLIDEQLFSRNVTLAEYKLGKEINPRDVRDADIPAMLDEARAMRIVTNNLLMYRESEAATLATTSSNYPSSLYQSLSAGSRWDDTGDPEAQKQTADTAVQLMSGIKRMNAVLFDVSVKRALRSNRVFIDRVKYTSGAPITMDQLKQFFDVDYVFIAGNSYDSANEGGTRTVTSPWGKNAIFFQYDPSSSLEDVSFGHMYLANSPFFVNSRIDESRIGAAGPMKIVTVGTEYKLDMGYVESSSSTKFAAGYLLANVIS